MKNIYLHLIYIMFIVLKTVSGQVTGDYRTVASGNWDALSTWQMFNGTTFVAAIVKPGTTNNVFIGNGFNVIANTNEACKNLVVQDFSTLTLQHNIINSGDVSIGGTIDLGISTLQNKGGGGSNENFTIGGSPVSLTGDITSGSTTITIVGAFSGVVPGMTITGTGIPSNTCVLSVSGFNIILSQSATSTASGQSINISGTNKLITANPLGIDGSIIQISRNFTAGANYIFNAATTAPFPAATSITTKDITINSSITLNDPVTVNGTLTLSAGNIITTSSTNLLTLGSASTFTGGSSNSYINGPLQLTYASTSPATLFFPIGKDNSYRPISLNLTQTTATATTYKAEVFNTPPVNRTLPGTLSWVSFVRYFNITKGTGANISAAHITINYDVTGIDDGITDASNLRVAKDNGLGAWVDLGGDVTSINFTGSITPSSSFTTFGDFVLANNTGGSNLLGGQLPTAPILISPANLAVNVPVNPTLVWVKSPAALTYRLLLASDPNFTNIILNDSTLADTTRLTGTLQNNTNYYWKINGKNLLGTGAFSTVFNFKTIVAAPGVPVLVSPSNNSLNQPSTLTLNWNNVTDAASYGVQIATDSSFNTLVINDTLVSTTSRLVSSLSGFTKYFWRVKATNISGTGGYSASFSFTTILSAPLLLSPVNGDLQGFTWEHFTWSPVNGAQTYHFQLAKDSLFAVIVVEDSTLAVTTSQANPLTQSVKYYWRVLAKNQFSVSSYSTVFNFVAAITGVNDNINSIPTSYNLYQNYPNPFNPSTVIKFDLPEAGFVMMKIYDILGKEVRTIVNDFRSAGQYNVSFNASSLPTGIYILTIKSNNFSAVRKLMLLK